MKKLLLIIYINFFFKVEYATFVVDFKDYPKIENLGCLVRGMGYEKAIIRCLMPNGEIDPNCGPSAKRAHDDSYMMVSYYMSPCFSCGNPQDQAQKIIQYLKNNNIVQFSKMVYIDIDESGNWSSNHSQNQQFFESITQKFNEENFYNGVHSSKSDWLSIMGNYSGGSSYSLWYKNLDGQSLWKEFDPFGGWVRPYMKQFAELPNDCGVVGYRSWYADYPLSWYGLS